MFQYLRSTLGWIAVILLPLVFSLLYYQLTEIRFLTLFYVPNLIYAALVALMLRYLFYQRSIMRFRMIACSLIGAALLALNVHALIWLSKTAATPPTFASTYLNGLIIFVFVTFGLSLADMIVLRSQYRQPQEGDPDADEEQEDV